jgi:hypothetical protein
VSGYGISLAVPDSWRASVDRGSWRLTSAQQRLTVQLFEDTADSAWSPGLDVSAYRNGAPRPFTKAELARRHAGRNFRLAGRLFDLFISHGRGSVSGSRLSELNEIVRSIRVRPGDFYPGRVAPARFRPAHGWLVRHQGSLGVGTENWVETVASTAPWTDALNNAVPTRSLARLRRARGVAVFVSLQADNRFPPAALSAPLRLGRPEKGYATCGPSIPGVSTQSGTAAVRREYGYSVQVIYGSTRPTPAQRTLARAELARLVLPRWPRWPGG